MMRNRLPLLAIFISTPSWAGEIDADVGLDFFYADSKNGALSDGEPTERLRAQDIGLRIRVDLLELDDRLSFNVDYLGREPVGGRFLNATHRLLYRAEISYEIIEDTLTAGLGRFLPASAVLLPVDGARFEVRPLDLLTLRAFGGRRAINTSRQNVALDRYLPAFGGGASLDLAWLHLELAAALAGDDVVSADTGVERQDYNAFNLLFNGVIEPIEGLRIGTRETFVDQANVVLGPSWGLYEVDVQVLHFFGAALFADYSPLDLLRISADVQYQAAAVVRSGTTDGTTVTADEEPTFFDAGLAVGVFPFEIGWARPNFRARRRPDRTELRYGLGIDVVQLGLPGLFLRGFITYEDVRFDSDATEQLDLDRLYWSAAIGYSGYGVDVEAGARFNDRFDGPFSGRAPDSQVAADLAPFVLEAQRVAFIRAFYVHEWFFVGADLEQSLKDSERRFFLQAGTMVDLSW